MPHLVEEYINDLATANQPKLRLISSQNQSTWVIASLQGWSKFIKISLDT